MEGSGMTAETAVCHYHYGVLQSVQQVHLRSYL